MVIIKLNFTRSEVHGKLMWVIKNGKNTIG